MTQITEINTREIVELLRARGVEVDEISRLGAGHEVGKWSYHDGFMEGESKWALRLCVDGEERYKEADSLIGWTRNHLASGEKVIAPHAAAEHLAANGVIPPGEYLIYCSW